MKSNKFYEKVNYFAVDDTILYSLITLGKMLNIVLGI